MGAGSSLSIIGSSMTEPTESTIGSVTDSTTGFITDPMIRWTAVDSMSSVTCGRSKVDGFGADCLALTVGASAAAIARIIASELMTVDVGDTILVGVATGVLDTRHKLSGTVSRVGTDRWSPPGSAPMTAGPEAA